MVVTGGASNPDVRLSTGGMEGATTLMQLGAADQRGGPSGGTARQRALGAGACPRAP